MEQLTKDFFVFFAFQTGILGNIKEYSIIGSYFLLLVSWMSVFMGIKMYRSVFSVLVFLGTALLICCTLQQYTNWGTIVTTFSVIGIVTAFIGYKLKSIGASTISTLVFISILYLFRINSFVFAGVMIFVVLIAWLYPAYSLIITTSVWGIMMLYDMNIINNVYIAIISAILGSIVQFLLAKNELKLGSQNRIKFLAKINMRKDNRNE